MYKGKYHEGQDKADPSVWKTRLRCALNKSSDFVEVPERSQLDISDPYKVYKIQTDQGMAAGVGEDQCLGHKANQRDTLSILPDSWFSVLRESREAGNLGYLFAKHTCQAAGEKPHGGKGTLSWTAHFILISQIILDYSADVFVHGVAPRLTNLMHNLPFIQLNIH